MLLKSERWEATTSIYTLTSTGEVESNPLPLFGLGAKVARRRKLSNRVGSGSTPAASTTYLALLTLLPDPTIACLQQISKPRDW